MGGFYELDRGLILKFEKFVENLLKEDVKVIFFFPPYHPYIYKHLIGSNKYRIVLRVESYFKRVASQNNIEIIGSYSPEINGFDKKDFFDARHVKTEAIGRLFRKYGKKIRKNKNNRQ